MCKSIDQLLYNNGCSLGDPERVHVLWSGGGKGRKEKGRVRARHDRRVTDLYYEQWRERGNNTARLDNVW